MIRLEILSFTGKYVCFFGTSKKVIKNSRKNLLEENDKLVLFFFNLDKKEVFDALLSGQRSTFI